MESGLHRDHYQTDLNYKNPVYIFYAKRLSKETACHHYQRFSQ